MVDFTGKICYNKFDSTGLRGNVKTNCPAKRNSNNTGR